MTNRGLQKKMRLIVGFKKMPKETTLKVVDRLKGLIISAFDFARDTIHAQPDFNEAAEGETGGGAGYHGFHKGILPGVRDAMMVDNSSTILLRNMRANSAQFTKMHLSKG